MLWLIGANSQQKYNLNWAKKNKLIYEEKATRNMEYKHLRIFLILIEMCLQMYTDV